MDIKARIPGKLIAVHVKEGDSVKKGDILAHLEAMKLENPITAPVDGTVGPLTLGVGDIVKIGEVILTVLPAEE